MNEEATKNARFAAKHFRCLRFTQTVAQKTAITPVAKNVTSNVSKSPIGPLKKSCARRAFPTSRRAN